MAAPSTPVTILTFGGVLAATPFGVSIETIALGVGFAVVGMLGRFAFDIQKSIEAGDKIKLIRALGWAGAGLIGCPFATVVWVVFLRAIGAQTDSLTIIGLLFLGFSGPKGVTWMWSLLTGFIARNLPKGLPAPPKIGE